MKKILAILLALSMVLSLAACGDNNANNGGTNTNNQTNDNTNTETDNTGKDTNTEQPTTTGEKVLNLATKSDGADDKVELPWQNLRMWTMLMFRTLFTAENDLTTVTPDLASDYKVSDDGLTYTITVADGNKWSDGTPITANDVAFSIKTNLKAAVSNGIYTNAFKKIVGSEAWRDGSATDLEGLKVNGNTITMTLATAHRTMIPVLAQFIIIPEHILKDTDPLELQNNVEFWSNPVVSGPFKVTEWNTGNYFTMELNDQYTGQAPKITKVVVSFVSDYVTAAKDGKMDYYNTNSMVEIDELSKVDGMTMYPVDILFYRYFIANIKGVDGNENPVMADPKVREAILYAIDRETIVKELFPNMGVVNNSGVVDSSSLFNGVKYEYNPEKAKQLLQEANFDFNKTFRILYYHSDPTSVNFIETVVYYLEEIGMKVQATLSKQSTQDLFTTRDYDIGYKGLATFDSGEWYGEYNSTNANFQNIFGGDTAFDQLIGKLDTSASEAETADIYKQLQKLENEKLYKLPIFTQGNNIFVNTNKVVLPEGLEFGHPWYKTNNRFAEWDIK